MDWSLIIIDHYSPPSLQSLLPTSLLNSTNHWMGSKQQTNATSYPRLYSNGRSICFLKFIWMNIKQPFSSLFHSSFLISFSFEVNKILSEVIHCFNWPFICHFISLILAITVQLLITVLLSSLYSNISFIIFSSEINYGNCTHTIR